MDQIIVDKSDSYFFAANAVFLLLGPMVYLRLNRSISYRKIVPVAYLVSAISGLLVMTLGVNGPLIFCILLIPASLANNVIGPPRMSLMLEQVDTDTGSAVSLIGATGMAFGSLGMFIMPLVSGFRIQFLGGAFLIIGLLSFVMWIILMKKPYIRHFNG